MLNQGKPYISNSHQYFGAQYPIMPCVAARRTLPFRAAVLRRRNGSMHYVVSFIIRYLFRSRLLICNHAPDFDCPPDPRCPDPRRAPDEPPSVSCLGDMEAGRSVYRSGRWRTACSLVHPGGTMRTMEPPQYRQSRALGERQKEGSAKAGERDGARTGKGLLSQIAHDAGYWGVSQEHPDVVFLVKI